MDVARHSQVALTHCVFHSVVHHLRLGDHRAGFFVILVGSVLLVEILGLEDLLLGHGVGEQRGAWLLRHHVGNLFVGLHVQVRQHYLHLLRTEVLTNVLLLVHVRKLLDSWVGSLKRVLEVRVLVHLS